MIPYLTYNICGCLKKPINYDLITNFIRSISETKFKSIYDLSNDDNISFDFTINDKIDASIYINDYSKFYMELSLCIDNDSIDKCTCLKTLIKNFYNTFEPLYGCYGVEAYTDSIDTITVNDIEYIISGDFYLNNTLIKEMNLNGEKFKTILLKNGVLFRRIQQS